MIERDIHRHTAPADHGHDHGPPVPDVHPGDGTVHAPTPTHQGDEHQGDEHGHIHDANGKDGKQMRQTIKSQVTSLALVTLFIIGTGLFVSAKGFTLGSNNGGSIDGVFFYQNTDVGGLGGGTSLIGVLADQGFTFSTGGDARGGFVGQGLNVSVTGGTDSGSRFFGGGIGNRYFAGGGGGVITVGSVISQGDGECTGGTGGILGASRNTGRGVSGLGGTLSGNQGGDGGYLGSGGQIIGGGGFERKLYGGVGGNGTLYDTGDLFGYGS